MRRIIVLLSAVFFLNLANAKVDIKAGEEKATTVCAACHGKDGNSVVGTWPKLAGQHQEYIVLQLKAFKEGKKRYDPSMAGMVAALSVEDMQNLAAYFNSQKLKVGEASPKNLKRGEAIYRGGDESKHISACIACHGPDGRGNAQAGFPALSGQHAQYVVEQLKNYKSGKRQTDINHIMRDIASRMDEDDMKAVANYISGLH